MRGCNQASVAIRAHVARRHVRQRRRVSSVASPPRAVDAAMEADDELAAQQLASVTSILLTWLRADADGGKFGATPLPDFAQAALAEAAKFRNSGDLEPVLRELLARAALARTAAHLACSSKAVGNAVRQHNADLVGAAGAARWAHAAAMARIVVQMALCVSLYYDERICSSVADLCEVPDDAADWKQLADNVDEYVLNATQDMASAMFGTPMGGPLVGALMAAFNQGKRWWARSCRYQPVCLMPTPSLICCRTC